MKTLKDERKKKKFRIGLLFDIQITIIVLTLFLILLEFTLGKGNFGGYAFIFFYFILGGFQLLHFLFYPFEEETMNLSSYKIYRTSLAIIFILLPISIVAGGFLFFYLFAMLFIGVAMAILFLFICGQEISFLKKSIVEPLNTNTL